MAQYDALATDDGPPSRTLSRSASASGSRRSLGRGSDDGPIALRSPRLSAEPPAAEHFSARASLDTVGSGSDIVYRDQLDQDPFDEKHNSEAQRYQERYDEAQDEEQGYAVEPNRVSRGREWLACG